MGEYLTADRDNALAGGVFNSRNLQTYHYGGNNPIKYTDPTGMSSEEVVDNNAEEVDPPDPVGRAGQGFSTPEEAAKAFGEDYGEHSQKVRREYGANIYQRQKVDKDGKPMVDKDGNPIHEYYYDGVAKGDKIKDGATGASVRLQRLRRGDGLFHLSNGDRQVADVHTHPWTEGFSPGDMNGIEDDRQYGIVGFVITPSGRVMKYDSTRDTENRRSYAPGSKEQKALDQKRTSEVR